MAVRHKISQCDLFTSPINWHAPSGNNNNDNKKEPGMPECINFDLHVSIWTWCAFTMWHWFGIENLIWSCTFCSSLDHLFFFFFIHIRHIHLHNPIESRFLLSFFVSLANGGVLFFSTKVFIFDLNMMYLLNKFGFV